MSKTIRISEEVYQEIERLLEPRETFSQVINRVLKVYRTIRDVSDGLPASHYLKSSRPPSETLSPR